MSATPSETLAVLPKPSTALRRPTFLYIGTPKAGSTWIYDAFRKHPDVFIPTSGKDINFFDANYHRGWDWYLRHFKNSGAASAIGEVSHDYYLSEQAARRIRSDLPDIRLICCIREPGDFAISWLQWCHSHTTQFGSTFSEIAESPAFASRLSYLPNLSIYFELFRRDQILVLFYDDLKADPHRILRELYRFVGVDPTFQPAMVEARRNPTRVPRNRALLITVVTAAEFIRRHGGAGFVGRFILKDTILHKLLYRYGQRPSPSVADELDRIAQRVRDRASIDLDGLARLIQKPLPVRWLNVTSSR